MKLAQGIVLAFAITTFAAQAQPDFIGPQVLGTLQVPGLYEASGIVASRDQSGVLWTHNDGELPLLIAIDSTGKHLASFLIRKIALDFEDIAIGPGPTTNISYIYFADIGDNDYTRGIVQVFRFPEPSVYQGPDLAETPRLVGVRKVQTLKLRYPDGTRDAETLFVDPISGDLFIITKQRPARVYLASRSQLDKGGFITMSFVMTIPFNTPSGGDISWDGRQIIIRDERSAIWWHRAPEQSVANALGGQPWAVPVPGSTVPEPNGEGVGFDGLGTGYFTVSDSTSAQPLYYFARTNVAALPIVLLAEQSNWRYLDDGMDRGVLWRTNAFDDSAWPTGEGRFGYGRGGPVRTTILRQPKALTTLFRKQFYVPSTMAGLWLRLIFDDGAAVYLNGTLALLKNLPPDPNFFTRATGKQRELQESWFTFQLDPSLLRPGTNTLAVEVHQSRFGDSDMRFDAQLIGVPASEQ